MRLSAVVVIAACGANNDLPQLAPDAPWQCGCEYGQPQVTGAVTPDGANELSGLVASLSVPDTLWTHNDGGKNPRLFALNTYGAGKGIVTLPGAPAVDWEDITAAPCASGACIYISDTGDNTLTRASVQIFEVDEPADFRGTISAGYRLYTISYPDGPHDGEALFVDPRDGASYLVTKQKTVPATVFLMPRVEGTIAMASPVATFTVPNGDKQVTGADLRIDECGVRLMLRTYSDLWELAGPPGTSIVDLFAVEARPRPVAIEPQGESIAFLPSGHAYVTVTDGSGPVLSRVSCK